MKRPLAFFGGLLVILAVSLSIPFGIFGWWNYSINTNYINWINAFGGLNWDNSIQNLFDDDAIIEMIPGVLAAVGALMLLIQNKGLGIFGAILIFAGIGILCYNMMQVPNLNSFVESLDGNIFWWENGDYYSKIGYGLIAAAIGSLLGLIGSLGDEK